MASDFFDTCPVYQRGGDWCKKTGCSSDTGIGTGMSLGWEINDNATGRLSVLAAHLGMRAGTPARGARKPGAYPTSSSSFLACPQSQKATGRREIAHAWECHFSSASG